ncbi:MAG: NADPH-dependent FMN reductase [Longimicrobiales bacterium]
MLTVPVLLGSVRRGRQSVKVARFAAAGLNAAGHTSEIMDLADFDFPIMEERLRMRDDPPDRLQQCSDQLRAADAVVVVSPEYNGGVPGVLKNALDYLSTEWAKTPVGIISVSAGGFGGVQAQSQLQLHFLRVKALPIASMAVSNVGKSFAEDGAANEERYDRAFTKFLDTLTWYAKTMKSAAEQ